MRVRFPSSPFDSLRSLMAGHSMGKAASRMSRAIRHVVRRACRGAVRIIGSYVDTRMWHVYILKCSDDSYYVGHTENLSDRVLMRNSRRAAKWTACRLPVKLAYSEACENEENAMARERQIKRWSRAKKEALIAGDKKMLHNLAKRQSISSSR